MRAFFLGLSAMLLTACSVQQFAINSLSDVLASGNVAFETDDDPVLVGAALPFSLKIIDGLLLEEPDHRDLLLAAASGYVFYSFAYVSAPALPGVSFASNPAPLTFEF